MKDVKIIASQKVKERDYWLGKLSEDIEKSYFPYDRRINDVRSIKTVKFSFEGELFLQLMKLSNGSDIRLFVILTAGLSALLGKYTGKKDILVGAPIYKQDVEGTFINTVLPLRNRVSENMTFKDLVLTVSLTIKEANENQNYPWEILLEQLNMPISGDSLPLSDTALLLGNIHDKAIITHINFNMIVSFLRTEQALEGELEYNASLYRKTTIERIITHFTQFLRTALFNPEVRAVDIDILTESEKKQLLIDFNDTRAEYPRDKTIHDMFMAGVEKTPDHKAIVFENEHLSYGELHEKSNRLARVLREKGVMPGHIVGLLVERSLEMIVGIFAVLKAGGAYLPVEPGYPKGRIDYLLKDTKSYLLLVLEKFIDIIDFDIETINLEDESLYHTKSGIPGTVSVGSPHDPAYIIYTSGSTGLPKGVMIEHQSVINRLNWMQKCYSLDCNDVILQKTTYVFDVSVWELFWWFFRGASLYLLGPGDEKSPGAIANAIRCQGVTTLHFVPSMLTIFLDYLEDCGAAGDLTGIRQVFASGEALGSHQVKRFNRLLYNTNNSRLINLYGPTEAAVDVSFFNCDLKEAGVPERIPIGKPIDNIRLYIVDRYLKLQPVGTAGELCIAGDGVARGYVNRPELTAERFSSLSYKSYKTYRTYRSYKTGDLARWLPDGNIEYLGRMDNQVKIRGFRIELGEIEFYLLQHEEIKETVVLVHTDKNKDNQLCAYVVTRTPHTVESLPSLKLGEYLSQHLPGYMLPTWIVPLERIPLTPNGKIDRKALPGPGFTRTLLREHVAPRTLREKKLAGIWADVLGIEVEGIGINDEFFKLGGHSLTAVIMLSRIHKVFNVKVQLGELINIRTVRGLAEYIAAAAEDRYAPIEPVEKREYYPVSSAQKRLYILQQIESAGIAYNLPQVLMFEGDSGVDLEKLEQILKQLVLRHESLRTSFAIIGGEPMQRIHDQVEFTIKKIEEANTWGSFVRPFDLSQAPLLRVGLIKTGENKQILMVDMHHIVTDGHSQEILSHDFMNLYHGVELPGLRIHYKDFSHWQNSKKEKEKLEQQGAYWLKEFEGEIPVLNLPSDYPRPVIQSFEGDAADYEIPVEIARKLNDLALEKTVTLYMVLLAVFTVMLYKISGQEDIVIGTPVAARRHEDLNKIIGMFVNTLALRNYPSDEKTFADFLLEVKERTVLAFENQEYPFEELVDRLNPPRDPSRNPLFDISLVFQNVEQTSRRVEREAVTPTPNPFLLETKATKFDITLSVYEKGHETGFGFEYCTSLFKQSTIERLQVHFITILRQVSVNSHLRLAEIDLLSPKEKQVLLEEFCSRSPLAGSDMEAAGKAKILHQLFEEQVERTPDRIALVGMKTDSKEVQLTYRELNEKSNRLAWYLKEQGVGRGFIAALLVERSLHMVVGMLAVLKAGAAYLPVDPQYPRERLEYIFKDSGCRVLLNLQKVVKEEKEMPIHIVYLDEKAVYGENRANLANPNHPDDLVYIIYTSGTTGKPRGVMVEHRGIVNLCTWHNHYYSVVPEDRATQYASIGFDACQWEIFPYLVKGAALHIIGDEIKLEVEKLNDYYRRHSITISFLPTQFCQQYMEEIGAGSSLRALLTGGDKLGKHLKTPYRLYNNYGPTENTVVTTTYAVGSSVDTGNIPIGKPIANNRVYILSKDNLQMQPIGVAGELCIAGDSLARGYLNQPQLTAEKFLSVSYRSYKSYRTYSSKKIYKTGDLARWLPDKNIEFLGRIDRQVKIRGYRIEPGEIEYRLLNHESVKEAVVTIRESSVGVKNLYAYLVVHEGADFSVSRMREYLAEQLPQYMIPAGFIPLTELPVTRGGKVDRKLLPDPEEFRTPLTVAYTAPNTELEKILASTWKEVLKVDRVGINDNFFELGGNSLDIIKVNRQLKKILGREIPVVKMFTYPTIALLLEYLKRDNKDAAPGSTGSSQDRKDKESEEAELVREEELLLDSINLLGKM